MQNDQSLYGSVLHLSLVQFPLVIFQMTLSILQKLLSYQGAIFLFFRNIFKRNSFIILK